MRVPSSFVELMETAERIGSYGVAVRAVVLLDVVLSWAIGAAVGTSNLVMGLILLVIAVAALVRPDTAAPLALLVAMTITWMVQVRPVSVPWSLVLGLCVLGAHVGTARAAALAPRTPFDRSSGLVWARQTGVVALITVVLWGVVVLLDQASPRGLQLGSGLALVAVFALGLGVSVWLGAQRND